MVMPMAYKVYVTMLVQKLRKETEMRRMIPYNQTRFRKGQSTTFT